MNTLLYYIKRGLIALAVLLPFASCDSFVYDDEGDCSVTYRLKFRYDRNLLFADAFAHEIKSVRLYAFDAEDRLVWQTSERGEALATGNYTLTLPLAPGKYRLIAWCGLGDGESFNLPDAAPSCRAADLHCRMNCIAANPDNGQPAVSKDDLQPLFHGMMEVELPANDDSGEYMYEMPLTKDTKVFRVVMQQLSGEDVNPDDFQFTIEDVNGWLAHDNSLYGETPIVYRPWALYAAEAGVEKTTTSRAVTQVKAAVAEFTLNRLFIRDWTQHQRPRLTIRTKDGDLVASLPVIDYALLVKGEHLRKMDDQEYLDRMDSFNLTLILDQNNRWISTVIEILSWRVVINNTEIGV